MEISCGLGMDALVTECSWGMDVIIVRARKIW